nr:flocculation protein FLO11-like isoform X2 [Leptinotarsa decemlineata]
MGGYAWVTLATNDSYSLGALVLARSLEQVGTRQQLAVLVTPGVTKAMRSKLTEVFNVVQEVNLLDSRDEENLRLLKRPELGVTFTKLHCWRLTQFDKCVFLDADTLVLENCDELFDREELSAAPDVGWPDCFNSGVFVFRPSNETYKKIIRFAMEKGSFDGGDQGLLNLYFSDWSHKDISKHLPFIYNMSSTACYSYLPAFKQFGKTAKIIHFIGFTKPWLQYFDSETKKVHPSEDLKHLQEILQHWWDLFCAIHSSLSPEMAGLAGAFAKLTLGTPRTPEQAALDDHLRRQGWEVGNIDYLGRDSFKNIWSKICETLSAASEQPVLKTEYHKVEDKPKEISPTEVDSVEKAILESKDKQVTPLSKSQIEVEIESSKQVGIQDKVEATSQTAFISLETETLTKSPSSINADQASFPTSSESQISATIPSESLSVSPTPAIHVPENPTSVSAVPSTQPAESPTSETLPVIIPAPLTPSTDSTVTESPAPQTTEMEYPVIPKSPVLEAPTSSTPASSVTDTPATVTSNHVFPTPVSTLYETPATVIVAPTTPAPITVGSETSGDIILAPTIPTPAVPVKIPVTLSPETSTLPAFIQTCPENLATATLVSKTPVPESPTPAVPDITPIGSMPEAPQPTEEATVTKEETFETVSVLSKDPPKIGKISRDTAEKSREIQTSKTHVTKTTSPSTTVSAQTEETKPVSAVATDVLDTPPVPAPESSFAPKPTPRKSNRSDKKSGTKTKK